MPKSGFFSKSLVLCLKYSVIHAWSTSNIEDLDPWVPCDDGLHLFLWQHFCTQAQWKKEQTITNGEHYRHFQIWVITFIVFTPSPNGFCGQYTQYFGKQWTCRFAGKLCRVRAEMEVFSVTSFTAFEARVCSLICVIIWFSFSPKEYRILGKKGEGTFSEVLKVQDVRDGNYFACKKMKQRYERWECQSCLIRVSALISCVFAKLCAVIRERSVFFPLMYITTGVFFLFWFQYRSS